MRKNRHPHIVSAVGAIALLGLFGGAIAAATPKESSDTGVFRACVGKTSGQVRAVASEADCKPSEYFTEVRSGAQGATGADGATGPQGLQGEMGPMGPTGADGRGITPGRCRGGTAMVGVNDDATIACSTATTFAEFDAREAFVREGVAREFPVRLASAPTSDVEVVVTSLNPPKLAVDDYSSGYVTITPENWMDPPTVTLTTPTDADTTNPGRVLLQLSERDPVTPNSKMVDSTQSIMVLDTAVQQVVPSVRAVTIGENQSAVMSFHLATPPSMFVSYVFLRQNSSAFEADVVGPELRTVEFTATNYATDRLVELRAFDDANVEDDTHQLCFGMDNYSDPGHEEVCIDVLIVDDDEERRENNPILPSEMTVTEGESIDIPVRLSFDPQGQFEVEPFCFDVVCDPSLLVFDSTNWDSGLTFRLTAPIDDDTVDDGRLIDVCPLDGFSDCVSMTVVFRDRDA